MLLLGEGLVDSRGHVALVTLTACIGYDAIVKMN